MRNHIDPPHQPRPEGRERVDQGGEAQRRCYASSQTATPSRGARGDLDRGGVLRSFGRRRPAHLLEGTATPTASVLPGPVRTISRHVMGDAVGGKSAAVTIVVSLTSPGLSSGNSWPTIDHSLSTGSG